MVVTSQSFTMYEVHRFGRSRGMTSPNRGDKLRNGNGSQWGQRSTSIVLDLFHSEGTCIITLNPDGVRRIVALAMDHDMLISTKRIAGLASIIERCGDEIRLSTLKRWEETLKEGSRSI